MAAARALIRVSPPGSSARSGSRAAISALHACTRADAGAERSAAIAAKMLMGSIVVGSTPIAANAFAVASARVGRPPFRFGPLWVTAGSSTVDQPSNYLLQHSHRRFLACPLRARGNCG